MAEVKRLTDMVTTRYGWRTRQQQDAAEALELLLTEKETSHSKQESVSSQKTKLSTKIVVSRTKHCIVCSLESVLGKEQLSLIPLSMNPHESAAAHQRTAVILLIIPFPPNAPAYQT